MIRLAAGIVRVGLVRRDSFMVKWAFDARIGHLDELL